MISAERNQAMSTDPSSLLTGGDLRFCQFEPGCPQMNQVRIRVDNRGHIVYWRYKDRRVFKQKELAHERNYLFIDKIYDVRYGAPTDLTLSSSEQNYEQNFLTIVSGSDIVHLKYHHFVYIGTNLAKLKKFATELFDYIQTVKREEHGLIYHFRKLLIPRLVAALSPRCLDEDIMRVYDRHRRHTSKEQWVEIQKLLPASSMECMDLDDQKIVKIICILTKFEGSRMEQIFKKISLNNESPGLEEFGDWVRKHQHDHRLNDARFVATSNKKIEATFSNWHYSTNGPISPLMFAHWLSSDECGVPVNSKRMRLDSAIMREPINRYFIASSHNTYCSGNQLVYARGHCGADVEMYRQVLLSGCRCIELDVWDNKDKDESPVITHGPTAVMGMNEILLSDVCEAIKETAFKTSPYPVILSIENHLGRRQQQKMVQIFRQIFGEMLLSSPLPDFPVNPSQNVRYPSPEDLKYKILVKAKMKRFEKNEQRARNESIIEISQSIDLTEDEAIEHQIFKELSEEQRVAQISSVPEETSVSELSAIINYLQAYESSRSLSFEKNCESAALDSTHCIVSMDENAVNHALRNNNIEKIQMLSKLKMLRIYPKSLRIYSTNYSPMIHWLAGAQMVALNYQTNCANMQLNYAMFERNGNSGYVRKPDYLRFRNIQLKPFIEIPFTISYTVEIEVICAFFLSTLQTDKYRRKSCVNVQLIDVPPIIESSNCSSTTAGVSDTRRCGKMREEANFVTNYDRQVICFDKVVLNDLSFVQFSVLNENESMVAQRILHIDTMNNGHRLVMLRSPSNQCVGPACILVRFDIYMHSDRKNVQTHKQMYNPHAFDKENDKWIQRFSDPYAEEEESDSTNDFLLIEGTRRGSSSEERTTPQTINTRTRIIDRISFWKKK